MTNPNTNPNQERLAKKDIGGITAGLLQLENVTLKLIHNQSTVYLLQKTEHFCANIDTKVF